MKDKIKQINRGFTLVEMLVVIAIIAVLAGILVPVIARAKTKAKVATVRIQMAELDGAIKSYNNDYERYPMPKTDPADPKVFKPNIWGDSSFHALFGRGHDNGKVMEILTGNNPSRNPKKNKYLAPKESGANASTMKGNRMGGVSTEGRYFDPFGNEFVISMDKNRDGFCADNWYAKIGIPGVGLKKELINNQPAMVLKGSVMIWTAGPDGLALGSKGAMDGVNADNILHWN